MMDEFTSETFKIFTALNKALLFLNNMVNPYVTIVNLVPLLIGSKLANRTFPISPYGHGLFPISDRTTKPYE